MLKARAESIDKASCTFRRKAAVTKQRKEMMFSEV